MRRDERAFASGGFADVRKGELVGKNFNRRKVCLKTIKVTVRDGEKVREDNEKVRGIPFFLPPYWLVYAIFMVLRRSTRRSPFGCD